MFFMKKASQTFQEYINSLTAEGRQAIMNNIAKYGDSEAVLKEVMAIEPCCLNKKIEVRINNNFCFYFLKKLSRTYLYRTEQIKYCFHSVGDESGAVGLVLENGRTKELNCFNAGEDLAVYNTLQSFVHGFDELAVTPGLIDDSVQLSAYGSKSHYFFNGNALWYCRYTDFTNKRREHIQIENIQDIAWCEQNHWTLSEDDGFYLDVYCSNQKKPVRIDSVSIYEVFLIAMELKKRVPHMMYGPNEEYKRIFKQNPEALMSIAKSKQQSLRGNNIFRNN